MSQLWQERLKSWLLPQPHPTNLLEGKVEAGLYHYQLARDDGFMRFHLRVERSGDSLLIAGASEVLRLPRDWTVLIKRLLDGEQPESLVKVMPSGAEPIVAQAVQIIDQLGSPSSRFPVFNLWEKADDPRDAELLAPFQADMDVEDLGQLRSMLHRLWDAGIPHARFLPAMQLRDDDLVQAVEWAEDIGMIAGVRRTASWLMESDRIARLAGVGLDYLLYPWAVDAELHASSFGDEDLSHLTDAIGLAWEQEVTPVVEIPLIGSSIDALTEQWTRLLDWNVRHVEIYALATEAATGGLEPDSWKSASHSDLPIEASRLRQLAAWVEETADHHAFQVTWLPPVAVSPGESVTEKLRRGPRAGGDVTIRVLANGDVLPARGSARPAGNLLADSWNQIWGSEVFHRYRERVEANTRCDQCPGLATCAADCPADPKGWSHD